MFFCIFVARLMLVVVFVSVIRHDHAILAIGKSEIVILIFVCVQTLREINDD